MSDPRGSSLQVLMLVAAAVVGFLPTRTAPAADPPAKSAPPTDRALPVKAILRAYGPGPSAADVIDPDVQVLSEEDRGDHVRRTLSYLVEPGERVKAYLLLPKPLPTAARRLPLIL